MFVFLSKFLPLFVYPLGLACVLLVIALFRIKAPVWQRAMLSMTLLVLVLGGNRWVAMSLAYFLEHRYWSAGDLPAAEAAVILGGGTLSADFPRSMVEINGAGDRILYAAQLYQQGKAEQLLLSGGFLGWDPRQTSPAQDMAELLQDLGVPQQALWLEPDSRNTYENAVLSAKILEEKDITEILLVTSAWHMLRAEKLFKAQGLQVIPAPVDFVVTQRDWESLWSMDWKSQVISLIPSAGSLALTSLMLKEYYGILVYELRGWQ